VEALAYLHNVEQIVHLNVNPHSIVVTKRGMWKLTGFAFAVSCSQDRHPVRHTVRVSLMCIQCSSSPVGFICYHGRWNRGSRGSSCSPNFWHGRAGHSSCSPKSLSLLHCDVRPSRIDLDILEFCRSVGRSRTKKLSASRGLRPLTPHQGLCPWTPLGAPPPNPR